MWGKFALIRAWVRDLIPPTLLVFAGVVVVGALALTGQMVARSPLLPEMGAMGLIVVGFLPEVCTIALPVSLFMGTAMVARRWREGGEFMMMASAGGGGRVLLPALLLTGVAGGLVVAALAHGPGPSGRRLVRQTLERVPGQIQLEPGRFVQIGDVFIHVGLHDKDKWSDVFIARDDLVIGARAGHLDSEGTVHLAGGSARRLASAAASGWRMSFDHAALSMVPPPLRVHAFEMSDTRLSELVGRMQSRGRSAHAEQLVLYKRTSLAVAVPFMVLLGWPLGVRWRRPGPMAVATVLLLWGAQRMGDHAAVMCGAAVSAGLPVVFLALLTAMIWWSWAER